MVKNVVTSDKNIKKAVELYGQDKVNATLAKQSAKGATITNTSTNTVVPPKPVTPTTPIAPTSEEQQYNILPESVTGKKSVVDSINALKTKQQVSSTPAITEPVQTPVTPAPATTPVETTVEPVKVEGTTGNVKVDQAISDAKNGIYRKTDEVPTKGEPVKSPRQILAENLTLEQTKNNLAKYRTGQELFNAVKGGLIREGTREYNNLAQANPDLVNQYKTYQQDQVKKETINTLGNVVLGNEIENKPVKTSDQFLEYFAQGLDDDLASTYAQNVTNNPEYLKAVKTLDDINTQIADNNKAINGIYTDVRASLSSSTPESMVASRIAREAKPLIEQGMYLAELAQNAESSMNRIYDANKENFDIQMQDRNQKRQTAFQLYGTIRAEEIRQEDIIAKEEELKMAMEQAKSEQEYLQYKDERDYNLKVAEAMQKSGQWQADYDLKAAEFDLKANEANRFKASDYLKTTITGEDGSTREVFVNPTTGEQIDPSQAFGQGAENIDLNQVLSGYSAAGQELLSVPDGTVIPTRLGAVSAQNASIRGKECAEYVNDIAGTKMGNTYASKQAVCNEPTGGVGSVVAWKPNGSGAYGHTGIIVNEDEANWYVKSSNYVPGTVTTEKVPKGNIKNFYTPESVKQLQEQANQEPVAKKYANGNIRTADGVLIKKEDAYKINKDITNDKAYEALVASEDMKTAWDSYKALVDEYGIESMQGKAKGEMSTAYNGVLRAAQKFFALGVFQPYDQKAIEEMIPKYARDFIGGDTPSKFLNPLFREELKGKLKGFEDFIQNKIRNEYDSLDRKYGEYRGALSGINDVDAIYAKVGEENLISEY